MLHFFYILYYLIAWGYRFQNMRLLSEDKMYDNMVYGEEYLNNANFVNEYFELH